MPIMFHQQKAHKGDQKVERRYFFQGRRFLLVFKSWSVSLHQPAYSSLTFHFTPSLIRMKPCSCLLPECDTASQWASDGSHHFLWCLSSLPMTNRILLISKPKVVALHGEHYFPQVISPPSLTAFRCITSVGSDHVLGRTSAKFDLEGNILCPRRIGQLYNFVYAESWKICVGMLGQAGMKIPLICPIYRFKDTWTETLDLMY